MSRTLEFFFDYGSPTADRGFDFKGQFGLAWNVMANAVVALGVEKYKPYHLDDRKDQKVITASFTLKF